MLWSRQEYAFAMEAYFSNGRLVIAVQRAFHRHFDIHPQGHVPNWKCILMWVDAFREAEESSCSSLFQKKVRGSFQTLIMIQCDNDPTIPLTSSPKKEILTTCGCNEMRSQLISPGFP
ncbi:hypothetical protein TNCV_1177571 [Trichonephila clavipes]|nr:hypothetical protein TNCV_1177571 [Trichonephila clavipes]